MTTLLNSLQPEDGPAGSDPMIAAARGGYPLAYLTELARLDETTLRLALADFANLMLPVMAVRAAFRTQALASLSLENPDMAQYHVLEIHDFRIFAAAIGNPPRLPGLTQAELKIEQTCRQLHELVGSCRAGVSLGSIMTAEYMWAWVFRFIENMLQKHPDLVPTSALVCFTSNHQDEKAAAALAAKVQTYPEHAARGVCFGATQTATVLQDAFNLLANRLALLQQQL